MFLLHCIMCSSIVPKETPSTPVSSCLASKPSKQQVGFSKVAICSVPAATHGPTIFLSLWRLGGSASVILLSQLTSPLLLCSFHSLLSSLSRRTSSFMGAPQFSCSLEVIFDRWTSISGHNWEHCVSSVPFINKECRLRGNF